MRELAPQVLGALVRRLGHFDLAEDAVQEALLAAFLQWPEQGRPADPHAWLFTVAFRRMTDRLRSDSARVRREEVLAAAAPRDTRTAADAPAGDDTLVLLLLCCHPELTPASQVALALRAVGGLRTADIAAAFMVPESTMGQRISRAKARLRAVTAPFAMPSPAELRDRLGVAMEILYLIFNEGYTATMARAPNAGRSPPRPSGWPGCCAGSSPTMATSQVCWR